MILCVHGFGFACVLKEMTPGYMWHNYISAILKAPQSQDITHTGLPTLDEIIQGPAITHRGKT